MADFEEMLKLVGSILGLVAFIWNVWGMMRSYLVLSIDVRNADGLAPIVKVSVSNSGLLSKMISYAALIVSPETMTLSEAAQRLTTKASQNKSALVSLFRDAGDVRRSREGCMLVPLRELYQDQTMVGPGEAVSYACSLGLEHLAETPVQVVRFIVFISYAGLYVRWRYTSEALRF